MASEEEVKIRDAFDAIAGTEFNKEYIIISAAYRAQDEKIRELEREVEAKQNALNILQDQAIEQTQRAEAAEAKLAEWVAIGDKGAELVRRNAAKVAELEQSLSLEKERTKKAREALLKAKIELDRNWGTFYDHGANGGAGARRTNGKDAWVAVKEALSTLARRRASGEGRSGITMKITDKMRLDWLSKRTMIERFWCEDDCVTRLFTFDQRGQWGTLRQAIDAAIRARKSNRGRR